MDREYLFTGYCRALDGSRMVIAETDGCTPLEADCDFGSCPHQQSCPIAEKLRQLQQTTAVL